MKSFMKTNFQHKIKENLADFQNKIKENLAESLDILLPIYLIMISVLLVVMTLMYICSFANKDAYDDSAAENEKFSFSVVYQQVNNHDQITVYRDNITGVYYIANKGGITPLLNSDGNLVVKDK